MSEPPIEVLDSQAAGRANVFYALARILEPPLTWDGELPSLIDSALGPELSAQVTEMFEDRESAAVAHAKLFLGPFEILVAPWGSFYLEEEPRLMGPTSHYVAGAYAEAGLAPGEKLKDTPDHVKHELEFMYFLAFNEATTGDPVWAERQERFWQEHLGRWLPRFAEELEKADIHPFYRALAETVSDLCVTENDILGDPLPAASCGASTPE